MLAQALLDPLNQRFVLLSETCVPLYPAPLVWVQLQGETRSRLNACAYSSDPSDEDWRMAYRSAQRISCLTDRYIMPGPCPPLSGEGCMACKSRPGGIWQLNVGEL